jgi:hypothetical protein
MTTYAVAHIRTVDMGPAIVDYLRRTDGYAGHRATDVLA